MAEGYLSLPHKLQNSITHFWRTWCVGVTERGNSHRVVDLLSL